MSNPKRSRGTNCRLDCPGRAASGESKKSHKHESKSPRGRQRYGKKRQNLVHNPEEEVWHEPYMQPLHEELSRVSIVCDSKIELPWKDIAVTSMGEKIKPEATGKKPNDTHLKILNRESTHLMKLSWSDLVIEDIPINANARKYETRSCDSMLEIPWNDLTIEDNWNIAPMPMVQTCQHKNVEIPWNAILVPKNVIIESKKLKHPSSKVPSKKGKKCLKQSPCSLVCSMKDM